MFDASNDELCCNDDQAEILSKNKNKSQEYHLDANFIQIDTVFGIDCPICAVNLKRMWCEYTCNPNKANFGNITNYFYISKNSERTWLLERYRSSYW